MKSIIDRVQQGDIEAVRKEAQAFNIRLQDVKYETFKQTPIYWAALIPDVEKSREMTNFLISEGVDPKYKDTLKQSALFYAARENKLGMAQVLAQHGCSLNDKDQYGQTPIYYAC